MSVVDLAREAAGRPDLWSPRVVADVSGTLIKVARLDGAFVWHDHAAEDEAFLVLQGTLTIRYEDRADVTLGAGELHVVPAGVRHCPVTHGECLVALIEPASTAHTGDVVSERTRSLKEQIG